MLNKELKKGFTLIELMVVLVLVVIISSMGFEFLLKPAMGINLDGAISDFIQYFQYVQGRNLVFSSSTSNSYLLDFVNSTTQTHYFISYVGSTTNTVDKIVLPQNTVFSSPSSGNIISLRFCPSLFDNNNGKFLCNQAGTKLCDQSYTISVKSTIFNLMRTLYVSTSSTDYCVPKLTRQ